MSGGGAVSHRAEWNCCEGPGVWGGVSPRSGSADAEAAAAVGGCVIGSSCCNRRCCRCADNAVAAVLTDAACSCRSRTRSTPGGRWHGVYAWRCMFETAVRPNLQRPAVALRNENPCLANQRSCNDDNIRTGEDWLPLRQLMSSHVHTATEVTLPAPTTASPLKPLAIAPGETWCASAKRSSTRRAARGLPAGPLAPACAAMLRPHGLLCALRRGAAAMHKVAVPEGEGR